MMQPIGGRHPETVRLTWEEGYSMAHSKRQRFLCRDYGDDIFCSGELIRYTHDTYPLARCTECGQDFILTQHRHSRRWSARPVPKGAA